MKKAFTIMEIIVVILIISIVAALSYPAIVQAREASLESVSISRLKNLGIALNLYREQTGGSDSGTQAEMGLPLMDVPLYVALGVPKSETQCASPKVTKQKVFYGAGVLIMGAVSPSAMSADYILAAQSQWKKYSAVHGVNMPFVAMRCHNSPETSRMGTFAVRKGLGVRISGELIKKISTGDFNTLQWWLPQGENTQ